MKNSNWHNRSVLRVVDLTCMRRERVLFENLGFEVTNGGLAHISGPNGSGKTSLLRILCGLLQPAAGSVHWNGTSIHSLGEEFSREITYLGHLNGVKEDLNASENLSFSAGLAGLTASPHEVSETLDRFGLHSVSKVPCRFLSQGQKRRLAIARLLLFASRPLWILDEPFASLDADGIETVRMVIEQHLGAGGMAILTTHQAIPIHATAMHHVELAA